jgi:ankyrin repeat protein
MRSRMSRAERQEHDAAWGLDFGDPAKIRVAPEPKKGGGFLKNWFGKKQDDTGEHPMSENMAPSFREQLREDPSLLSSTDDRGWSFLHQLSLAGSTACVKVLLDAGADANAATPDGKTPLQLARSLGWEGVAALLMSRGAT